MSYPQSKLTQAKFAVERTYNSIRTAYEFVRDIYDDWVRPVVAFVWRLCLWIVIIYFTLLRIVLVLPMLIVSLVILLLGSAMSVIIGFVIGRVLGIW